MDILSGGGGIAVSYKRAIFGVFMMLFFFSAYAEEPENAPRLYIFVSFNMPEQSLKLWASDAARLETSLLLRGFVDNDLKKTTAKTLELFGEKANIELLIDPEKFQKFKIDVVPAVVIAAPEKVAPTTEDTTDNAAPPFDVVYGDTSLEAALNRIAKAGVPANQKAARHYLKKYREQHE